MFSPGEGKQKDRSDRSNVPYRDCPFVFYLNQPLILRVIDPTTGKILREDSVAFPRLGLFSFSDAKKVAEVWRRSMDAHWVKLVRIAHKSPNLDWQPRGGSSYIHNCGNDI